MHSRRLALATIVLAFWAVPFSSARAQDAQSRLWDASISGDTAAITIALSEGASIDSLDTRRSVNGRRALNWAAWNNRVPALRLLLARGASINATNRTGFTALHHAAESGSDDALKFLLEAGADWTIPSTEGSYPVDTARLHANLGAVALLENAEKKKAN
ncbi:MAG: ankyrin repeat domain-containing protein [Gemmatimonadota bacterium]